MDKLLKSLRGKKKTKKDRSKEKIVAVTTEGSSRRKSGGKRKRKNKVDGRGTERESAPGEKKEKMSGITDQSMIKKEVDEEGDDDGGGELPCQQIPSYMKGVSDFQKVAYICFARQIFQQGVHGLLNEFNTILKPYTGSPVQRVIFDENPLKNRYKDIICNDVTRVAIEDGKGSDYIHANYVHGIFNKFILTQGPMPATTTDFWRMILFTKANHIIMLCETVECGKTKCEQYWPEKGGEKLFFGCDITVEQMSQKCTEGVLKTMLRVTCPNVTHFVRHCQVKTWPDRSIPKGSRTILRILGSVRSSLNPVVVHCSAGVGRTGTLVAIELSLQKLLATGDLKLIDICKHLRDQRMHVLQVDLQFVYLAQAVLEYGKSKNYWDNNSYLLEEFAKFRATLEETQKKRNEELANPMPIDGGTLIGAPETGFNPIQ